MAWWERDYQKAPYRDRTSFGGGIRRPPSGALALIVTHTVAFLVVMMLRFDAGRELAEKLALSADSSHGIGILTHPFATGSLLTLAIVIFVTWTIGARIEERNGTRRLFALYVAGNLFAGLGFFVLARLAPDLAQFELDYPVGGLTAWCVVSLRGLGGEQVNVLGKMQSVARLATICVLLIVGFTLALRGRAAVAWLAAIAIGGLTALVLERLPELRGWKLPRRRRPTRRRPTVRPSIRRDTTSEPEPQVDDVLAKISREGLNSLTPDEQKRLEAARRAMREKSSRSLR